MAVIISSSTGFQASSEREEGDRTLSTPDNHALENRSYQGSGGYFTENLGQWDDEILFMGETDFGHVAFTRDSILYNMVERSRINEISGEVIRVGFVGSNPAIPRGSNPCGEAGSG